MSASIQGLIRDTVPTIASAAIGASAWWTMRSVGIATFSPIGVGLGIGAYEIVKHYAQPFFINRFYFKRGESPTVHAIKEFCPIQFTNLSSLAAALIPIYFLGVTTLFTFTPMIETLLFIKGIEVLTPYTPALIERIGGTVAGKLDEVVQYISDKYNALSQQYSEWRARRRPAAAAAEPSYGQGSEALLADHPEHRQTPAEVYGQAYRPSGSPRRF